MGWLNLFDITRPVELSVPREYFGTSILAEGTLDDPGCGDVPLIASDGTLSRADGALMGEEATPSGLVRGLNRVEATRVTGPCEGELTALVGRVGGLLLADAMCTEGALDGPGCGDVLLIASSGTFNRADGARTGEEVTPSGMVGGLTRVEATRVTGPGVGEFTTHTGFVIAFGAA